MGTQQILLIVLSVIIVGIAVAVGITMFNAQATNSNRQAIVGDMNNQASSALAYFKTPLTHGGGAGSFISADAVGTWIGYDWDGTQCTTGNGTFIITFVDADNITIVGLGTEVGSDGSTNVSATMGIIGSTSGITTTILN
jgi:hypothetical protein